MANCLECNREFESEAKVHLHIRAHDMLINAYYEKHFPRFDKLTGEKLLYKDKESYLLSDFKTKENLITWLKTSDKEIVRQYVLEYFQARKLRKNLVKAPTQIELKSLNMPGKKTLNKLFGSYRTFFDSLGLQNQFSKEEFTTVQRDISKQKIIVDTREQQPLEFDAGTRSAALKFGDYRLSNDTISAGCYIERKSIMDFHGTMGKGFDRFVKEVQRASSAEAYLVVVVEGVLDDVYRFANRPIFNKPLIESKRRPNLITSPQSVLSKMRDIIYLFDNVQFLFVGSRENASKVIQKLFSCNGEFKNIDLQYAYDTGALI